MTPQDLTRNALIGLAIAFFIGLAVYTHILAGRIADLTTMDNGIINQVNVNTATLKDVTDFLTRVSQGQQ